MSGKGKRKGRVIKRSASMTGGLSTIATPTEASLKRVKAPAPARKTARFNYLPFRQKLTKAMQLLSLFRDDIEPSLEEVNQARKLAEACAEEESNLDPRRDIALRAQIPLILGMCSLREVSRASIKLGIHHLNTAAELLIHAARDDIAELSQHHPMLFRVMREFVPQAEKLMGFLDPDQQKDVQAWIGRRAEIVKAYCDYLVRHHEFIPGMQDIIKNCVAKMAKLIPAALSADEEVSGLLAGSIILPEFEADAAAYLKSRRTKTPSAPPTPFAADFLYEGPRRSQSAMPRLR